MTKVKVVKKLTDKGFPTHAKEYKSAHEEANKAEKKRYPKGYEKMKSIDKNLAPHELAGKNLKNGNREINKKVPKENRREVDFHETEEHVNIKRIKNKKDKSK